MDDSTTIKWLIFWCVLLFGSWIFFLILSTCMGPQIVSALRGMINGHWRRSQGSTWDAGGIRSSTYARRTFLDGRGGNEGYEMAMLSED
ncbi:uncharacterized protein JCM15063_005592 [Sporobolomyces koalae]|uniref:uncharacterized protein n=1 Tax=Sporobolomyces koalae TaxID=500713 RepID=UPI00317448C6